MPSLGARLGVAHSGLYRYVGDRDKLVVATMDRIARQAPWPAPGGAWRESLSLIGETLWTLCETYPGYDVAAVTARNISPGFVEHLLPHVEALRLQGFDVVDATAAIDAVRTLVLNSSIDARRLAAIRDDPSVPEHGLPGFDDSEKWEGRAWYRRHLETYLDGLESRIEPPAPATA